jgi:3-oxosteroid 1-dehydrogenase
MNKRKVVVLGTGGAGLTAAVAAYDGGAEVLVFEKADKIGGTTAWSGGMVWIPNNHLEAELGVSDSRDEALLYLNSMSHDLIEPRMAEAFVDAGPLMVRYLCESTPVNFRAIPDFPDYHAEFPGGKTGGGRSLDCPPFSFDELGDWAQRVTPSPYYPDPRLSIIDTPLGVAKPTPLSPEELERRSQKNVRGSGQALIGRLLRACLDRGIEPRTQCRAKELLMDGGSVRGVLVDTPEGAQEIAADAVIICTGGFEWNEDFKRAFLRGPMTHPVSIETNTGDGLRMAMKSGAMLGNMREAWWMPVIEVPREEVSTGVSLLAGTRSLPRSIMINRKAKRFVNEAANYNVFGAAFHEQDVSEFSYANLPCWLVFDQGFVERYGFGMFPDPGAGASQWIASAPTLSELANRLDIPPESLEQTVARWNAQVQAGKDDDFGRGVAAHDRWWGDPDQREGPQANLGPLDKGPFYAVEVKSGALGTKGGPRVDPNANVLNLDSEPISGLYAAGNVMASPMGMTYGGPGGTIAPGMVFGFVAGRHAAGKPIFN